ncbi:hypothetical protein BD309DRAFT_945186 [Dichomitus squalens]|nr:hypothetical protein BD309DRAFT_945186 [Dichomitus squalens]
MKVYCLRHRDRGLPSIIRGASRPGPWRAACSRLHERRVCVFCTGPRHAYRAA